MPSTLKWPSHTELVLPGTWEDKVRVGKPRWEWLLNQNARQVMIAAGILLLSAAHWLVPRPDKQFHNLLYHFDFIPILMAGVLFGWRASVLATVATTLAELPLAWRVFEQDHVYLLDQAGETAVFGIAGVVVGYMAERSRRQNAKLERATHELAQVNLELQQNLERLKKAERMYAVAQLSASLAHEIRNPLAGISGAAGILKRGNAKRENMDECLEIIDKESHRLNKLLTNFLEFARPRTPRFQATDLSAVVEAVIALAGHSAETRHIRFACEVEEALPEVPCDSEQLKQVLLNLVMNAVQATGEGVVHLRAWAQDGKAFVAVRDHGQGIPQDQQDRIFDPFFTTKENGNGLGLAIASKIIEQHGGALAAQNNPGHGLTMVVELPLNRTPAA